MNSSLALDLLVSAVVAAIVAALLRVIFEARQQHQFDEELERIRQQHDHEIEHIRQEHALQLAQLAAQWTVNAAAQQAIAERKISEYNELEAAVYRSRNACRDLCSTPSPANAGKVHDAARQLEDLLFRARMDLSMDHIFLPLHSYKNSLLAFDSIAGRLYGPDASLMPPGQRDEAMTLLEHSFRTIDQSHSQLCTTLTSQVVTLKETWAAVQPVG